MRERLIFRVRGSESVRRKASSEGFWLLEQVRKSWKACGRRLKVHGGKKRSVNEGGSVSEGGGWGG